MLLGLTTKTKWAEKTYNHTSFWQERGCEDRGVQCVQWIEHVSCSADKKLLQNVQDSINSFESCELWNLYTIYVFVKTVSLLSRPHFCLRKSQCNINPEKGLLYLAGTKDINNNSLTHSMIFIAFSQHIFFQKQLTKNSEVFSV